MHILEVERYFCGAKLPCAYLYLLHCDFFCWRCWTHSFIVKKEKKWFFMSRHNSVSTFYHRFHGGGCYRSSLPEYVLKTHCSTPYFPNYAWGFFLMSPFFFCVMLLHLLWILSLWKVFFSKQKCKCYKLYIRVSRTLKCEVNTLCNAQIILRCSCITTHTKDNTKAHTAWQRITTTTA